MVKSLHNESLKGHNPIKQRGHNSIKQQDLGYLDSYFAISLMKRPCERCRSHDEALFSETRVL